MNKLLRAVLPLVTLVTMAAVGGLAHTAQSAPAAATTVAQTTNCVKYAGVESSSNKNSMDPAQQPSSQNSLNVNASYDRLTTVDDNWKVLPSLATSWKPSANGRVWTFQLRKDVKFWDGKPLTSADVVYTFRRVLDPKTGSEGASQMTFLKPSGIQPAGKYAVKFVTAKPVAELPLLITNKNTFIVQNGATTATLRTKGAGTGPFIPVDFKPVQQVHTFTRNPDVLAAGPSQGTLPAALRDPGSELDARRVADRPGELLPAGRVRDRAGAEERLGGQADRNRPLDVDGHADVDGHRSVRQGRRPAGHEEGHRPQADGGDRPARLRCRRRRQPGPADVARRLAEERFPARTSRARSSCSRRPATTSRIRSRSTSTRRT